MCGIAGFITTSSDDQDQSELLRAMTNQLAHRGPDGSNIWLSPTAGLGHRRLAIIDLNTGDQPMWDLDHEQIIVFNGEIYNYKELRSELLVRGYQFKTSSDTEIIPAVIKEWGISQGLLRLRGMFAFALYNTRTKSMLIARDRTGIKPIYWAKQNGTFFFASEAKSLLLNQNIDRKLDEVSLHDYLQTGYAITPRTIWKNIHFLPPGSWMEITPNGEKTGIYWQWHAKPDYRFKEKEWLDEFEATLNNALHYHLISDVPLGAFLSGGIDSSLTVAMLSSNHVNNLNTFNVSFDEQEFDEAPFALEVAQKFRTNHEQIHISLNNANPEILRACIEQFDEPFGDTASLPNYLLSQATTKKVKVVISGDGGDELLGGYPIYERLRRLKNLTNFHWANPLLGPAMKRLSLIPVSLVQKITRAWDHAQGTSAERLIKAIALRSEHEIKYTNDFMKLALSEGPTYTRTEKYIDNGIKDPIDQMLAFEMRLRLNSGYLRKTDVTSSAHGLETRVPFLDNNLLEFSERLPAEWKVRNGQTKYLGYKLAEKYELPKRIVRRKKHGFNLPFDHWSSAEPMRSYLNDTLMNPNARWRNILKPEMLYKPWALFMGKQDNNLLGRYEAYARVYSILALELWMQKWDIRL